MNLLSVCIFLPIVGATVLVFIPQNKQRFIKIFSFGVSAIVLVLAAVLCANFDPTSGYNFLVAKTWIPHLNITYKVGLDGISIGLFLLSALLAFVCLLLSFQVKYKVKEYNICMQLITAGMLGVFSALDLFLFFIFWELVLIPMYFVIGIWGGEKRSWAAIKFIIFTAAGSVLLLIGIICAYFMTIPHTFDLDKLRDSAKFFSEKFQFLLFFLLFLGFAVKIPIFPLHTWLPDAHVEAPTVGSVLLAGILLKMGGYGLFKIVWSLAPDAFSTPWLNNLIVTLGLINVLYGAFLAAAQKDLKRLVAYSSISHMGFVVLGISSGNVVSLSGALLQMLSHGLIIASLFIIVGVLYERTHKRGLLDFGGIANVMPLYTTIAVISSLAAMGLPGLSGFISEFLSILGTYIRYPIHAAASILGVVIATIYILYMVERVFFGSQKWTEHINDLNAAETLALVCLQAFIVLIGIYPPVVLDLSNHSIETFVDTLSQILFHR